MPALEWASAVTGSVNDSGIYKYQKRDFISILPPLYTNYITIPISLFISLKMKSGHNDGLKCYVQTGSEGVWRDSWSLVSTQNIAILQTRQVSFIKVFGENISGHSSLWSLRTA